MLSDEPAAGNKRQEKKNGEQSTATASPAIAAQPGGQPIVGVAEKYQKKASALLRYLLDTNKLDVLPNGNAVIDGQTLPNSNINDLINRSVNPAVPKYQVPGWKDFSDLLQAANAPKLLLSSKVNATKQSADASPAQSTPSTSRVTAKSKQDVTSWLQHDKKSPTPRKKAQRQAN